MRKFTTALAACGIHHVAIPRKETERSPVDWECPYCQAAKQQAQVERTCTWKRQKLGTDWDEYDSWGTSCGEDFAIVEEWHDKITPYCSNCGGKVEEQKP